MPSPNRTTNLRLNKPDFTQPLWHDDLNDNFEIIDAAITTYLTITNIQGVWENSTAYVVGDKVIDTDSSTVFECQVNHTSAASPTTFEQDRVANPSYWSAPAIVARGLDAWTPSTAYQPNDFVIGTGNIFAVCISPHTSSANFAADAVYWDYLLDLSTIQSLPSLVGNALRWLRVNGTATQAEWVTDAQLIAQLGLLTMAFQAANGVNITGGTLAGVSITTPTITNPTLNGTVTLGTPANWANAVGAGINGMTQDSTPDTAADFVMTYDASASAAKKVLINDASNGEYRTKQIFTANGTWNKPSGLKRVKVTVVGGGGSGGGAGTTAGSQASCGSGGGAGGAAIKWIEAASLGSSESVTVGASVSGTAGAVGTAGNSSSFGAHCSATGGAAGLFGSVTGSNLPVSGAAGGTGSGGDINIRGGASSVAIRAVSQAHSSKGGDSIFCGGGHEIGTTTTSAGVAGQANSGGGGSGGANGPSQGATVAGGAGAAGIVIVEEYY